MGPNSAEEEVFHDEVEIEDFQYDEETETFTYPCPCGDLFTIRREDLENGEEVATCPSCSLVVKVIYNPDDISDLVRSKVKAKTSPSSVRQADKTTV